MLSKRGCAHVDASTKIVLSRAYANGVDKSALNSCCWYALLGSDHVFGFMAICCIKE